MQVNGINSFSYAPKMAFKGNEEGTTAPAQEGTEKKLNITKKQAVIGGGIAAAAIAAGTTLLAASRGKFINGEGSKFFKNVGDGFKSLFKKDARGAFKELKKATKAEASASETLKLFKDGKLEGDALEAAKTQAKVNVLSANKDLNIEGLANITQSPEGKILKDGAEVTADKLAEVKEAITKAYGDTVEKTEVSKDQITAVIESAQKKAAEALEAAKTKAAEIFAHADKTK